MSNETDRAERVHHLTHREEYTLAPFPRDEDERANQHYYTEKAIFDTRFAVETLQQGVEHDTAQTVLLSFFNARNIIHTALIDNDNRISLQQSWQEKAVAIPWDKCIDIALESAERRRIDRETVRDSKRIYDGLLEVLQLPDVEITSKEYFIALVTHLRGVAEVDSGNTFKAIPYFQEALTLARTQGMRKLEGDILRDEAGLLFRHAMESRTLTYEQRLNEYRKAESELREALDIFSHPETDTFSYPDEDIYHGDSWEEKKGITTAKLAVVIGLEGRELRIQGQEEQDEDKVTLGVQKLEESLTVVNQGIAILRNTDHFYYLSRALRHKQQLLEQTGNYKDAFLAIQEAERILVTHAAEGTYYNDISLYNTERQRLGQRLSPLEVTLIQTPEKRAQETVERLVERYNIFQELYYLRPRQQGVLKNELVKVLLGEELRDPYDVDQFSDDEEVFAIGKQLAPYVSYLAIDELSEKDREKKEQSLRFTLKLIKGEWFTTLEESSSPEGFVIVTEKSELRRESDIPFPTDRIHRANKQEQEYQQRRAITNFTTSLDAEERKGDSWVAEVKTLLATAIENQPVTELLEYLANPTSFPAADSDNSFIALHDSVFEGEKTPLTDALLSSITSFAVTGSYSESELTAIRAELHNHEHDPLAVSLQQEIQRLTKKMSQKQKADAMRQALHKIQHPESVRYIEDRRPLETLHDQLVQASADGDTLSTSILQTPDTLLEARNAFTGKYFKPKVGIRKAEKRILHDQGVEREALVLTIVPVTFPTSEEFSGVEDSELAAAFAPWVGTAVMLETTEPEGQQSDVIYQLRGFNSQTWGGNIPAASAGGRLDAEMLDPKNEEDRQLAAALGISDMRGRIRPVDNTFVNRNMLKELLEEDGITDSEVTMIPRALVQSNFDGHLEIVEVGKTTLSSEQVLIRNKQIQQEERDQYDTAEQVFVRRGLGDNIHQLTKQQSPTPDTHAAGIFNTIRNMMIEEGMPESEINLQMSLIEERYWANNRRINRLTRRWYRDHTRPVGAHPYRYDPRFHIGLQGLPEAQKRYPKRLI